LANPVEQAGFSQHVFTATRADSPALVLSRKSNRTIDMSDDKPVQNSEGNIFGSETKTGDRAAAQLAEEELERVVGGYIGETEKNRN
jgi:hypothetical protein